MTEQGQVAVHVEKTGGPVYASNLPETLHLLLKSVNILKNENG